MASILYDYTPAELQNLLDTSNGYCDLLRKIGLNGHGSNPETLKKIIKEYNLDITKNSINRKKLFQQCAYETQRKNIVDLNEILNGNYNKYYTPQRLLKRMVKENLKEYKCEICGISEWNNEPITLVLHHIDGNNLNNKFNNLQILCPNCHSQTENYAGKSSKKKYKGDVDENIYEEENKDKENTKRNYTQKNVKLPPISKEDLKYKVRNYSFVSIAKEYGVSDKAVVKWCDKYQIPSKKSVIKKISDSDWDNL